jgi:hypothetical protein
MDNQLLHLQAPPSYALESSSGESDWDEETALRPPPSKAKPLAPDAVVEVQGEVKKGGEVVFLVGEAGERMSKGIVDRDDASAVKVLVDGEQVSSSIHTG